MYVSLAINSRCYMMESINSMTIDESWLFCYFGYFVFGYFVILVIRFVCKIQLKTIVQFSLCYESLQDGTVHCLFKINLQPDLNYSTFHSDHQVRNTKSQCEVCTPYDFFPFLLSAISSRQADHVILITTSFTQQTALLRLCQETATEVVLVSFRLIDKSGSHWRSWCHYDRIYLCILNQGSF